MKLFGFFSVDYKNIDIVIHPQSIIHSLIEFIDGSIKAQLSEPTMKIPIQFALSYPERYKMDEKDNTLYDLNERVKSYNDEKDNDILVEFDAKLLNSNERFQFLTQLPLVLQDSGEVGKMEYDIFKITINSLKTYENKNITCKIG